ncbi:peptide-methionine (S)-S-oxide reductase MsrA [Robertkochia aurantiaca]|uniref:peptide-methionine (S)-S-oxide reductase MsrA n=1 Tax=Robertkochia aurantiaca TaxID=2873700 RepID=UPI001CC91CAE|nr:peptide-methionine (S)-S-oxide reductase MsrA [Robertkochia sp. 3YJGBD-33]
MKNISLILLTVGLLSFSSCKSKTDKKQNEPAPKETAEAWTPNTQDLSEYETAYFASGCFWCVEAIFESVKGVKEAVSGYAGGKEKNPTYEEVSYGRTSHAEAVKVYYDPQEVSFATLVRVFFGSHDPTTLNRQGPDKGAQYRSIAFYQNEQERDIILDYMEQLEEKNIFSDPIVTEVKPLQKFWKAEDYHQDYERRNPNNSYIRNVSVPRLNRFKELYPELLKEDAH